MSDGQVLPTPHKTGLWLFVASAPTSVLLESDYSASISHLIARTRNSYEDSGCWTNCFDLTRRKLASHTYVWTRDGSTLRRFRWAIVFGPSKAEKDCYYKPVYGHLHGVRGKALATIERG